MKITIDEEKFVSSYALLGELDNSIEIENPLDINYFEKNYKAYKLENNILQYDAEKAESLNQTKLINELRLRREKECFSFVDRSQFWYDSLSEEQKNELYIWYQNWLEVTETLIIPTKPNWL